MRFIYIVLLCFLTIACSTGSEQEVHTTFDDSLCVVGRASAEADFNNHKLKLSAERITGSVYDSLLKADYGLSTYFGSKKEDGIVPCYDSVMTIMLSKKYGKNILKSSFEKSRLLEFYHQSGVEAEQLEIIDFSDLIQENYLASFLIIESETSYTTARKKVLSLISEGGYRVDRVEPKLEYDTNGKVVNIRTDIDIDPRIISQAIAEFNTFESQVYFEINGKRKPLIIPLGH